jgi:mRNA interferase RelE/StbE
MPYRVLIKPPAEKALRRMAKPLRRRIAQAIDSLARNPRPEGARKLVGSEDAYRIRVGDYPVVYVVAERVLVVYVVRTGHRREVYRGL